MSPEAEALRRLGVLVTGLEARDLAKRLEAGHTLTMALRAVGADRRSAVEEALLQCSLGRGAEAQAALVLRAVEGARSAPRSVHPVWTMPGHLARSAPLTTSVVDLVDGARESVTCSTYNLQPTSRLWGALQRAARRPSVDVRLYLDAGAATGSTLTAEQVADALAPGVVRLSSSFGGAAVRNHAKFVVVDHRWSLVSSANASWSAEQANIELGLMVDDTALAATIERQVRDAEDSAFIEVGA